MLLEVGMNIYSNGRYYTEKYTISRVTPKRAFVKLNEVSELSFNREVNDGKWFYAIGSSGWNRSYYSIETPELVKKYERQLLVAKVQKINPLKLTDSQLQKIIDIFNDKE